MHLVTDNTRAAMAHRKPISDALAWSRAFEIVTVTNLRILFAWWRMPITWWAR